MPATRFTERTVYVEQQTIDELIEDQVEYLNWLEEVLGASARNEYEKQLSFALSTFPPVGTKVSIPMVQLGNIEFSQYTYSNVKKKVKADPVNIVFIQNAKVATVLDKMKNDLFPPWLDTTTKVKFRCGKKQWIYVDNSRVGGLVDWVPMHDTLAIGGCAFIRCHSRLFGGGNDRGMEGIGEYVIANVHYETFDILKRDHVIQDWDKSQDFVERMFLGKTYVSSISKSPFQPAMSVQRIANDGLGTIIELK